MNSPDSPRGTYTDSVVIAVLGETKSGKTEIINTVRNECEHQGNVDTYVDMYVPDRDARPGLVDTIHGAYDQLEPTLFADVNLISAGNVFRAATLFTINEAIARVSVDELGEEDEEEILYLLGAKGVLPILQGDPQIAEGVSKVAAMPGSQALNGRLICESVRRSHSAFEDRGRLTVVDGRPNLLKRLTDAPGLIGVEPGMIHPASILPVYIEASPEVVAGRMEGDYAANLASVLERRGLDSTRTDHPVTRPDNLVGWDAWFEEIQDLDRTKIASPLLIENNSNVTLDNLQWLGGKLANLAQITGNALHQQRQQRG